MTLAWARAYRRACPCAVATSDTLPDRLARAAPTPLALRTRLSVALQRWCSACFGATPRCVAAPALPRRFVLHSALTLGLTRHGRFALAAASAFAADTVADIVCVRARTPALAAARQTAATGFASARAAPLIAAAIGFFFFTQITAIDVAACGHPNHHTLNHDDPPRP